MRISDWSSDVCSSDLPQPHHAASAFRSSEPSVKAPRRSRTCPVRPRSETEPGRRVVAKGDWFSALRMGWSAPNRQVPLPHTPIAALDREQSRGAIGRASCRERVCKYVENPVVAVSLKKKKKK